MGAKALAAVALLLVVTGCTPDRRGIDETTTATSSAAALSPLDEARQVLGVFDVALPADARDIRVVKPPLERFRAKAFVSFAAPRQQVIDQTCRGLKNVYPDVRPWVGLFESEILGYAGVTVDRAAYGYCDRYERGRMVFVLVPRVEGATTYVVVYHVPYH